ncbi:hypothetical protein QR680_015948 [Steinernema hermaphroditum]|uniref:Uncharacterized protein n=1 Tax=Steinernema hermaphroditum TaxID=289476 RepID=A0AA39HBN6_9BILA|nr:hypothetical protein QR680_015948 [Steinernema hermaphroditum]
MNFVVLSVLLCICLAVNAFPFHMQPIPLTEEGELRLYGSSAEKTLIPNEKKLASPRLIECIMQRNNQFLWFSRINNNIDDCLFR